MKSRLRENIEAIIIAIILAMFIRTFVVQAFKIPSGSMKETLQIGDHILVNKFIYGVKIPFTHITLIPFKKPKRGDIIVFEFPKDPDKDFIKRVIGEPGDTIEIKNKKVYINGKLLNEKYVVHKDPQTITDGRDQGRDFYGPEKVPENSYFVMGDNRDQSYDSRFWGFVNFEKVKGKAFLIYMSWDSEHVGIRWNRIGKMLE